MTKAKVRWTAQFYKRITRVDTYPCDMFLLRDSEAKGFITMGIDHGPVPCQVTADWIAKALNEAEKKEPSP